MSEKRSLVERPAVSIEIVRDESASMRSNEGFVRVRRLVLRNRYADGSTSREYRYDCAERDAIDAVGIVLVSRDGRVCLRSSIRPPIALRPTYSLPIADESADPTLFEVPAGLVEVDEKGEDGLRSCCARETLEEVGLEVAPSAFVRLGPAVYLTPGVIAEKVHLFVAECDPEGATVPQMDGSPVEERANIEWVPVAEALAACRDGRIGDVKTEVAIRRLADHRGNDDRGAAGARKGAEPPWDTEGTR
ncbi:NUDIX hydrolase [Sandaracinus amylolyticus]|uniref:NUDIX hydrolase n=1 Tax=Sandaracinus amylolyticus TaxID=927083 RepID=UPI0012ED6E0F|nr:NUDIX hydrolase [Sandaracinus amylolyticus]